MEFFTGNPQSVRGLGNILLDKKELDMLEYYSQVTQTEDIVNETSMKVFSMSYLDDSEDYMALPYDVNSFLLGAVASVSLVDNKLDVNRYESTDLEVVTLRQLKHALSGKVKDITYENNVLRVVAFERSDLTGLQTKAAIVSLLTNAVSDVRVVGNELVVDRWSAADVANGITRMEFEPHISVSATTPYVMSGETTDLVVSLEDESASPVDGELVTLTDGTSLYNGITNNQGIFTLPDISVSTDTTFTATYSGATDSCLVEYCLFVDNGTTASHYGHWYINSFGTATVQDDGTKLLNTSGDGNFVMRSIVPSNKTITQANSYSHNPPYIVEFDIVETDGAPSSNAQVQIYSEQTTNNFTQTVTTGHYKITVTSEEQKIWVDDTLIKTTKLSLPNARITLRVRQGKYLIYKNFRIRAL